MNADAGFWLLIVGRVLLGGLFVTAGLRHFFLSAGLTGHIAARGIPWPRLVLLVGTIFQIVAGLSLMFGLYVLEASLGLVAFTLVASFLMLNFWDLEGEPRETAREIWQVNLGVIGGLLICAAYVL